MTFIFEWLKTIFSLYKRAQRVSKILFLTREENSPIFKLPCNVLFISLLNGRKQKIVTNFTPKSKLEKSHVVDIFTSEDIENISLRIFSISLATIYIIK
jgi:hypothetical protein